MAGEAQIAVTGRLGSDPEVKWLDSGTAVMKASVASTQRLKDKDGNWSDRETLWYRVELWGRLAEPAAEHLSKGDLVTVIGGVYQSSWTNKSGETVTDVRIRAEAVGKVFTPGAAPRPATAQDQNENDPW